MSEPDEVMSRINDAVAFHREGDNAAARERLDQIWAEIGPDGDPLHRCTLAHFMADAQESPSAKLLWDQRALDAADALTDERAQRHHASLSVRGFYPSLHLNLAKDHQLLGDNARARAHIEQAKSVLHLLDDDGYGRLIRGGVERLDAELATPQPE